MCLKFIWFLRSLYVGHYKLNNNGYFIFDTNSLFGFEEVAQGSLNINLRNKFISIDALFKEEKLKTDIRVFTHEKNNLFKKEEDK